MQGPKNVDFKDRRAHARVTLKTSITMSSESNFYTGFMNDISEGGLFVSTYNLQPIGSTINLEFNLPDSEEPIKAQGVVRWLKEANPDVEMEPGLGVQFTNLSDVDRRRIEHFVKHRETIFFD
jgi:uncharacterized protein (TIGR02266 family)